MTSGRTQTAGESKRTNKKKVQNENSELSSRWETLIAHCAREQKTMGAKVCVLPPFQFDLFSSFSSHNTGFNNSKTLNKLYAMQVCATVSSYKRSISTLAQ